jgi:hypothetical protein
VTEGEKATAKRWYDDACGTALAMEFIGELTGVPLRVEGDIDIAYRFVDFFHLPEKIAD